MSKFVRKEIAGSAQWALERRIEALQNELESLQRVVAERDQLLRMKRLALSRMQEAAYLIDEGGRLVYANDEASRTLGYSVDELTRMSVMDIDPEWAGAKWLKGWAELRERGALRIDTAHLRKDGSTFPVEVNSYYFEYGGRQYNLSLTLDVSERRSTQQALLEGDERYRQIFDNVSDALYLIEVSHEGRFRMIEVNPACEQLFDRTRADLVERFVDEVLPDGAVSSLCEAYRRCVSSQERYEEDLTLELPRGPLHCRATLMPVRDASGRVYRIVSIVRDLTLQRQTQSLLTSQRELDARFIRLAQSSPGVICRYDTQCCLVFANSAFDAVAVATREASLGKRLVEEVNNETIRRYKAALQAVMDTGMSRDIEIALELDGGMRYDHVHIVPEFGPDGEVTGALTLGLDVTAQRQAQERLNASEQAFRAVVEHSPDYIARYDLQYRRVYANPALLSLMGCPASELLGKTPVERSLFVDVSRYMNMLRRVAESGKQAVEEMLFTDALGRLRWGHMRVVPEFGADGKVASMLAIYRDIDELKRSEQLFRALAENFPDLVCRFDGECRFTYVNPTVMRVLGAPWETFIGKRPGELAAPDDVGKNVLLEEGIRRAFAEGGPNGEEVRWMTLAGERVFEVRYIPEKDFEGMVVSVLGVARDITQMRATEQALRDSERAFRTLAENAPDPIIRYDLNCVRTYVNPELERVAHMSAEAMLGKAAGDRRGSLGIAGRLRVLLSDVIKAGEPKKFELTWDDGNEERCWYVRAVPEFNGDGAIQSVLTVWRDISERKESERRLRESYEMLRELTSRRETAREEERKRIAREMHDELGQQLTALRMGVSTLRIVFARNNPELTEHIRKILLVTDRTIQVVRDVVMSLRPMAIDVGIVAALEWLVAEFSRDGRAVCRLQVPQDGMELDEDRAIALFRIVQEALTNVARHAGAREVAVELQQVGDDCKLEVRDDGRGFDPETIRRNAFGLAGMRERVVMLGGEITVGSSAGRGTVIKVRVPVR